MDKNKKTIFSGIQPTGSITIGNYLGSIKNWINLSDKYNCIYSVVDLHALTIRQDPKEFYNNSINLLALYIACGLDYKKNIIFIQSHVPSHSELAWILNCYTYTGELSRMTQFKDKSQKNDNNINVGLFSYPVLMASDILLYNADLIPVGDDQKQHLELCRDIANRFNNIYGNVFKIPEPYISKIGSRIMSLTNPLSKMSKSDDNGSFISITESKDTIIKKFKKATTDSDSIIKYDKENKPGISNLLEIYSLSKNISIKDAEIEFESSGYGDLKIKTAESVIENITNPIQDKYNDLLKNKDFLIEIIKDGAKKANEIAIENLIKIKKEIGIITF